MPPKYPTIFCFTKTDSIEQIDWLLGLCKKRSASGGFPARPPNNGVVPWTPLEACHTPVIGSRVALTVCPQLWLWTHRWDHMTPRPVCAFCDKIIQGNITKNGLFHQHYRVVLRLEYYLVTPSETVSTCSGRTRNRSGPRDGKMHLAATRWKDSLAERQQRHSITTVWDVSKRYIASPSCIDSPLYV